MALTTYFDLSQHLLDYMGVDPSGGGDRYARRAVQAAINTLSQIRRWRYYYTQYMVTTNVSQTTGTISYEHTGGSSERLVTLSDATWPSWAAQGVLRIGTVDYEIASRLSSTTLTLSENSNPGEDVAADTAYTLFRDAYPLPTDFLSMGILVNRTNMYPLSYIAPNEWQDSTMVNFGPAVPFSYTIHGSQDYLNTHMLRFWPPPDQAYAITGIYQRRMRPVVIHDYSAGTITVADDSTTVTGDGTVWDSTMVGSIIRFRDDKENAPDGLGGDYPYQTERVITAVGSGTSLTIDSVTGIAYTATKYRISDPVDIFEGAMKTFLLRECEKQARRVRRIPAIAGEDAEYEMALARALEADSVDFSPAQMDGWQERFPWNVMRLPNRYYPASDG